MSINELSSGDKSKILNFLEKTRVDPSQFRTTVMKTLADIFGYDKLTFWLIDQNKNIYAPLTLNLDQNIIAAYQDVFFKYDFFHPLNMKGDSFLKRKVLLIEDIISREHFEKSHYFDRFLKNHNIHYELGTFLMDGKKLIGGIAMLRSIHEPPFDRRDKIIMEFLADYISRELSIYNQISHLEFQKKVFEYFSTSSPIGFTVIDEQLNIHYQNNATTTILSKLYPNLNPVKLIPHFFSEFMSNPFLSLKQGFTKTIFTHDFEQFTVHLQTLSRHDHPDFPVDDTLWTVVIVPDKTLNRWHLPKMTLEYPLTKREGEVLELVLKGCRNDEIAIELSVSLHTVKKHIQNIFQKFDVKNRTSLCYKINQYL